MIEILIATYNGGKYLEEQLNSIFNQTYNDLTISIRDDGSTDNTFEIITRFQELNKIPINILFDNKGRLGSSRSFGALLENCSGDYIMFCDQDDYWLENKVAITLERMISTERINIDRAVLVFTDLKEVDENLNILSESFLRNQKLYPEIRTDFNKLLALNIIAGCTVMLNRKAITYSLPIPNANIVHDQWIGVNIAKYGIIEYVSEATILYRQHTNNVVGANKIGYLYFAKKILSPFKQFNIYRGLIKNLDFKVNLPLFIYYKIFFSIKRIF